MFVNLDGYILVEPDTRWECQRCGCCCGPAVILPPGMKGHGGYCVNLEEVNYCKVYASRPRLCRLFPFQWFRGDLWIFRKCPGIGYGPIVDPKTVERASPR